MDDCLKNRWNSVSDCIKQIYKAKNPPQVVETNNNTVIDTATGVALGYGAMKLMDSSSSRRHNKRNYYGGSSRRYKRRY